MFTELFKIALIKKHKTQKDIADALGISRQNMNNKLSRDNFTESEMRLFCDALGVKLKIEIETEN